jgi:hypothetical protein
MPFRSDFRRHFLCYGICSLAVLSLVLLAAPDVRADTWTVKIDVSSEKDASPAYTVTKTGNACSYPIPSDAYFLQICSGDTVLWTAVTYSKSYQLKLFFRHAVLDDSSGKLGHYFKDINRTQNPEAPWKIT